ncbi:MAG TPA: strawberry notch C-terminal domain-containing protein, partial [Burkholderiaceae bacterium]|nr:strawberry notch C-terminal domain-containing protein [Burkholderiaceae bacterium]
MIRAKLGPDLADGITAVDLRSAYNVVAQDYKGTTSEDDVAKFKTMEQIMSTAETVDEKAGERAYIDAIKDRLVSEYGINSIMEARRLYEESTGRKAVGTDQKRADELLEVAIVETARDIVGKKKGDAKSTYDSLVKLYGLQPNLSTRTSTSVEQQAYSTPAPLAYLAGYLAGAETAKSAYEPTAGNGMLTISAKPGIWVVNELNAERNAALQDQGFKQVTKNDASEWTPEGGNFDLIVENPPFGTVKGPAGYPKTWELPLPDGKSVSTTEVDHAIVMKSLEKLKEDGSAALIVASIPKTVTGESARGDAYNGQNKRRFYYALYNQFNVVDHFTVSGDLYSKQGASWPVDVILIKGRGKSTLPLPSIKPPRIYDTWAGLKGLLDASRLDAGQQGTVRGPAGGAPVGTAGTESGVVPGGAGAAVAGTRDAGQESAGGNGPVSGGLGGGGRAAGVHTSGAAPAGGPAVDSGGAAGTTTTAGPAATRPAQGGAQFAPSGSSAGEGQNGPSGSAAANRGNVAPAAVDETGTNENQLTYHPQSALKSLGTLVPTNQQESVKLALQALADRVGDIDQFVMRELGYKNLGQLGDAFAAEQIDSLALAIDSMQRGSGFIIGDQTGIGKGRVVAGIIKWSLLNGRVPIFTTEKPNLYGDMIRDLSDIGMDDIRPMITNNNESIPIDGVATDYYADHLDAVATAKALGRKAPHMARVGSRPGLWLTAPVKEQNEGRMNAILSGGSNLEALKSAGFNMVFTTYNQMNRDSLKDGRGKPSGQYKDEVRHTFIRTLANGNALILDETHNAGGQKASRGPNQGMAEGRGAFFRQLVDLARSVFYSSATYAKRTDVMDLYSKTDMSKAVNGNVAALPEAIEKGGVPLMQVVSAMLVQAGQYIRRERSFNGVRYDTDQVVVDKVAGENLATTFRMIKDFDILKGAAVAAMDKELKSRGEALGFDNSMGDAGATSTNFTALMHNVVNQMLLALKAKQVVEYAVNALNAGEKPVITLANTMGSFIERYTTDFNLSPGDAVALSFKDVLIRYLKKARDVRIKSPDGKVQVHYLTDDELGPIALAQWKAAEKHIRSAKGLDELPISPIDYLHSELRKLKHPTKNRNVTTGEITGRTHTIEYSATGMKFVMRPESQTNAGARRVLVNQFNNDKVDILILNQAGSTGLSLHSSAKFKNQQPRHMIILQPELNIDTHMQMLGRVHRTGQVVPPRFTQLAADIPAETRPASVLAKKMAALSANTTASRKNALAASNVVDFMNEYGDQVAADLMRDMPDIHQALDEPLTPDTQGYMTDNALAKVTGRLPMLPLADQRRVYDMLESNYKDYLAQKIALGENALEAQTLDLQAKTIEKHTVFSGEVGDESPFAAGAYAELLDVKRLGKPYTWEELRKRISTFLNDNGVTGTSESDPMWRLSNYGHSYMRELRAKVGDEFTAYMTDLIAGMSDPDAIHSTEARLRAAKNVFDRITAEIHPGGQYRIILTDGSSVMAVAMGITRKKDVKLPVAPGAWAVDFAFADASRHIKVPFSQIIVGSADPGARVMGIQVQSATHDPVTRESIEQVFAKGQREVRERRVMLTGNLLAAYGRLPKGQIVNYTDDQGRHLQGILLARDTDIKK